MSVPAPRRREIRVAHHNGRTGWRITMILDDLRSIQEEYGYLEESELRSYSRRSNIPLYRLYGLATFYPHLRLQPPSRVEVGVCRDLSCLLNRGSELQAKLGRAIDERPQEGMELVHVSCLGQCEIAPAFSIEGASSGEEEKFIRNRIEECGCMKDPRIEKPTTLLCNPYRDNSSFDALRSFLEDPDPVRIITELKTSGLRGMGGAGFPTGLKWDIVSKAQGAPKYVICNADESEPGTSKDRYILENLTDLVVEGLALAVSVIGAEYGIIYIREEYHVAREKLQKTVARRTENGDINTSDKPFIRLVVSPGGYICGEETALFEALEDRRAEPRNKPPFPADFGLFGKPTLINNVETLAMVPGIVLKGGEWWASHGMGDAKGLKFLAVSGHVEKPGIYEVPLGIPFSDLLNLAGGTKDGKPLKAFSPGGASSGFLPASFDGLPLEFAAVAKAGSMLGSGAVVVVSEGTDMLQLALNVTDFFKRESCGKCVPCRVGCQKLVSMIERIRNGTGTPSDLDTINDLSNAMMQASICGLGQAAPNAIRSVIQHFPEDIHAYMRGVS